MGEKAHGSTGAERRPIIARPCRAVTGRADAAAKATERQAPAEVSSILRCRRRIDPTLGVLHRGSRISRRSSSIQNTQRSNVPVALTGTLEVSDRAESRLHGGSPLRKRGLLNDNAAVQPGVEAVCGRITQNLDLETLFTMYGLSASTPALNAAPRYNGCPTQDFVAMRRRGEERTLVKLRWGLVPTWAKDLEIGVKMINARSETVHEKPGFRSAFRRRRCVVPVNGWFEWRRESGEKQPYWIRPRNAEIFSLAGVWERWDKGEDLAETFAVLTTSVSPALADIHHRQPVIVEDGDVDEWLDPASRADRLMEMARVAREGPFDRWPVSRAVNNARNNAPHLIEPVEA